MPKSKSYGGLVVLVLLLAAAGGGGWYFFFREADEKKPEWQTAKLARGELTQAVTATGDLQPVVTVDVGAQVSGQIKEVLVDFNSKVKAGDVLARIDESTPTQRLRQAEADLESAKANNRLIQLNVQRTRDLFEKKLVSQQELDNVEAQLAQSNATLLTRNAAVANATLDLERTVITAPIDGIVLDRKTDKGRTVNANMNAPVLFTLVNDLSKMQINAAVAEADVGSINEGQEVRFTVDAFPNLTFNGTVRMVRNAATVNQSVVSYATIIDVNNDDMRLKPGMTANVSIIVTHKPNALKLPNGALRVRVPAELLPKPPESKDEKAGPAPAAPAAVAMSDEERRTAMRAVFAEAGIQFGQPPAPDAIEKAKKLAEAKGLDPEMISRTLARFSGGGGGGPGGGRNNGPGGGRRGGGPGAGGPGGPTPVVTRTIYKVVNPDSTARTLEAVNVRLGVSDGFTTEILDGLAEGDTVLTGIVLPNAGPATAAPGGSSNPFQGGGRSFGGSSSMRGR